MTENLLIALLGFVVSLFTLYIGIKIEKRRQSLIIRSQMLEPIEEWLKGAEKMIGIFYDTIVTLIQGLPLPMTYNLEERRKATQFMIENTNKMLGIIDSKGLQTKNTKHLAQQLSEIIKNLDNKIKFELLPEDNKLIELANQKQLNQDFINEALKLRNQLDGQVQAAYSIISKIRTKFT